MMRHIHERVIMRRCTLEPVSSVIDETNLCPECFSETVVVVQARMRAGDPEGLTTHRVCVDTEMCGWMVAL